MRTYITSKKIIFLISFILLYNSVMLAQPYDSWNPVLADTTFDNLKIIFGDSSQGFVVNDVGSVFALADSMNTWTLKDARSPLFALSVDFQKFENGGDTVAVVVGKEGKAAITIDGGENWDTVNTGTTNNLNALQFGWCPATKQSSAYAIGDHSTIRVSTDGGNTWTGQSTPYQFDNFYDLYFYNNEIGWIVGSTGIMYRTINSGTSWDYLEVNQSNPNFYGVHFISPTQGWVCGANGYIGNTTTGGNNWTQQNSGTTLDLNDIVFNPLDSDTVNISTPGIRSILHPMKTGKTLSSGYRGIAVGDHGTVLQTTDYGNTWTSINLGTASNLNDVTVDPLGYFWIVGDNGAIYTNRPKLILPTAPSGLSAVTKSPNRIDLTWTDNSNDELGFVLERKRGNGNWSVADSLNANVIEHQDMELSSNTEYFYRICAYNLAGKSTHSNEVSATTGTTDVTDLTVPAEFILHQNFPNPFNPETVISWQIPINSHVTLKIYDLLGREIETLVNRFQSPGAYKVTWQPKDLSNGIYIYKLIAENFSMVKKLVFLK